MTDVSRERRPEWIWPRGDSHVVLSAPGANDVHKTFVEPGGSFSPGVGSFGVSVWVWLPDEGRLVAPELLPREAIRDRLLGGFLPIARSRWRAGPLELDLRLAVGPCPDEHHPLTTLLGRAVNRGGAAVRATVLLVVRALGPAGGPITSLACDADIKGFLMQDAVRVLGSRRATSGGCVSLHRDGVDISVPLRRGEWPAEPRALDRDGWCGGYLAYELSLEPAAEWEASWEFPVLPTRPEPSAEVLATVAEPAHDRFEELADRWRARLTPVTVELPDARLVEAFGACLTHLIMAYAGNEPRIATLCYPLLWTRDTVYIVNALDKAGLTEFSRPGIDKLARNPWAGGFGPEADAPGEGLWALGEHWLLTRDEHWLREVYPRVRERAEWLEHMRTTREPLRLPAENVLPRTRLHPEQDLICEPAVGGLIVGRMDWHRPLFWVNAFAQAGLRAAGTMAAALGETEEAARWHEQAGELQALLAGPAIQFGRNERDTVCAVWPTEARRPDDAATAADFERWWFQNRYDDKGRYRGEPRWRYFELGQAHNLLKLGMRERALLTLEQFLRTQDAPGLYAWAEVDATGDPTGDWRLVRGGWANRKIMPHGWVAAEMALLIRDLLVFEQGDALVLGAGIKTEWLGLEAMGIAHAPTHHGSLSWRLEAEDTGRYALAIRCEPAPPPGGYRLRLPFPASAIVECEGVGVREENGDWPIRTTRPEVTVSVVVP